MSGGSKIILVEDDSDFALLLSKRLNDFGFTTEIYEDGASFLDLKASGDIILLDLMLPNLDGFRVLEVLKHRHSDTPVIVVSARSAEEDVVKALDLGALDYVFKPVRMKELVARINRLLDVKLNDKNSQPILKIENRRLLTPDGNIDLTFTEEQLLKALLNNQGKILSREELMDVIGEKAETSKVIDVHIHNLKKKAPILNEKIRAIRSVGYVYEP
ncbi:response regulator transcription factor [Coprothermobacter platensis]|uniref:response regulator transcription factor n=1 Tax=Coprothermobacter platensis TaxID=108819 RepID=UPI0003A3B4D0|nr:response regulator transcription factor [Coprothermobacter platensis]